MNDIYNETRNKREINNNNKITIILTCNDITVMIHNQYNNSAFILLTVATNVMKMFCIKKYEHRSIAATTKNRPSTVVYNTANGCCFGIRVYVDWCVR